MPNQISFFNINENENQIDLNPNAGDKVKVGDHVRATIGKSLVEGIIVSEYGMGCEILNIDFIRNGTKFRTAIGRKAVKAILKNVEG